jgi:hypothetical protein
MSAAPSAPKRRYEWFGVFSPIPYIVLALLWALGMIAFALLTGPVDVLDALRPW